MDVPRTFANIMMLQSVLVFKQLTGRAGGYYFTMITVRILLES